MCRPTSPAATTPPTTAPSTNPMRSRRNIVCLTLATRPVSVNDARTRPSFRVQRDPQLRLEAISDAADSDNVARPLGIGLELGPKLLDEIIYGPRCAVMVW